MSVLKCCISIKAVLLAKLYIIKMFGAKFTRTQRQFCFSTSITRNPKKTHTLQRQVCRTTYE